MQCGRVSRPYNCTKTGDARTVRVPRQCKRTKRGLRSGQSPPFQGGFSGCNHAEVSSACVAPSSGAQPGGFLPDYVRQDRGISRVFASHQSVYTVASEGCPTGGVGGSPPLTRFQLSLKCSKLKTLELYFDTTFEIGAFGAGW